PEPRITISFKSPPCLQGFELPLKDHIVSGIGIIPLLTGCAHSEQISI
ncbi:MAG: hypothetical protein ACI90A_000959, partial [Shewanella sp.]